MSKFRFLPEVATGGVAFEAFGKNERELLKNAALALEEAMVDIKTIKSRNKETITMRDADFGKLLFDFLEHLVFLKHAKQLLFRDIRVGVEKEGKSWVMQGFAYGERVDPDRHKLKVNVKGLAKELFDVGKTKSGHYRAQVVLGI
ncbi:archease [Candidatus Microgenomates bacterium]|nr:archease [Candidatus Microgenomates bacterium]